MWTPLIYDFDRRLSMHKEGGGQTPEAAAVGSVRRRQAAADRQCRSIMLCCGWGHHA